MLKKNILRLIKNMEFVNIIENILKNDIENIFKKNLYGIGLVLFAIVFLYITYIGISIISTVTDKTDNEEKENEDIKKHMDNIIEMNNIFMYILIGITVIWLIVIIGFAYKTNKNVLLTLKELLNNKVTLLLLLVLIVFIIIMNSFCNYIKNISENIIKQLNEDDKYKNWSLFEKSATANDELTNQGLAISISGSVASTVAIVLIVNFLYDKKKLNSYV
jgi:NADH:ubiquinone oxidoreductase subunit 5 (subunit L)/multisubunit Na+/H+ antiporter MnhA subunit